MGISAASNIVWIGRSPVRVSSMLTESMPTTAAPRSTSSLAAACPEERVARVAVALGAPVLRPTRVHEHCPSSDVEPGELLLVDLLRSGRVDQHARDSGDASEVEAGQVVTVGEAVKRGVEVGAGVGHHVDAADLELVAVGVAGA